MRKTGLWRVSVMEEGKEGLLRARDDGGGEKWVTPSYTLTETQRYGNLTAAEDQ